MASNHILLIHGTWCNGNNWGEFAEQLRERGYTVHTPSLRHHSSTSASELMGNALRVSECGLLDYVADLKALVDTMDSPPIIVGHSIGALLAQLLAARVANRGVVLLGPAPAAGILGMYPSMIRLWIRYVPQWLLGTPMFPVSKGPWNTMICNTQPKEISEGYYQSLCAESGKAYFEMCLWYLDRKRAARVDFDAIQSPVLVVTGSEDKCTVPRIGRVTAKKYGSRSTYVELKGSDHMMTVGEFMPKTIAVIDEWATKHGLAPEAGGTKLRAVA